jgi:Tfp pilus assembly protein PilV
MKFQLQSTAQQMLSFIKGTIVGKYLRNERGFSAMETIVALGIMLFVSTSVVGLFAHSLQATGRSKHYTAATYTARAKMEAIKDTDFASITSQYPDDVSNLITGTTNLPSESAWVVTYPNGTSADPLAVTVTVSWPENTGTHSVQLTTLVSSKWPPAP